VEIDADEIRRLGHGFLPRLDWSCSITACFSRGGFLYIIHSRYVHFFAMAGHIPTRPGRSAAKPVLSEVEGRESNTFACFDFALRATLRMSGVNRRCADTMPFTATA